MMSFVFETIIEFSAAITCSNICAQFVLMYRGLTSTYIMLIWMLLTMAPADLFVPRGTRVLVDNIFVVFAGKVRRKTAFQWVRIEPLFLPTSFWFSNEADFIQSLLSTGKKQLASRFNLTYRYTNDVLSINNPEFDNYLGQMYPAELEIKYTTESTTSASYLDLRMSIRRDGQLHTSINDKRDDFNFIITNFPFPFFAGLWCVYLSFYYFYTILPGLPLVWMFYSEGQAT